VKPVTEFPPDNKTRDGWYAYCRSCKNLKARERRKKKAEDEGRKFRERSNEFLGNKPKEDSDNDTVFD